MANTQRLSTLTNVVLALCALTVTGLVVRRELFPPATAAAAAAPEDRPGAVRLVPEWRAYGVEGHRWGPGPAPVDIVVFSDYQCPACRKLAEGLDSIRAEFPAQVAVVNRHYPLASHPFALPAARASECAARQGRFEAMHGALFASQPMIGIDPWSKMAQAARLPDLPAFERCMAETGPIATVARDTVAGHRLRVTGTPTFLINNQRYVGSPPLPVLRDLVRRAMAQAPADAGAATASLSR
ncbi:MAG TPA: DsbA family protein [Longimicrobium sp.]|jgi:protein-disulfide isomerase|nr:DsbA family protein [Longimicrobium sp.]